MFPFSVHVVATFCLYCIADFGSLFVSIFDLYCSSCFVILCSSSVHVVINFDSCCSACIDSLCPYSVKFEPLMFYIATLVYIVCICPSSVNNLTSIGFYFNACFISLFVSIVFICCNRFGLYFCACFAY